VSANKSIKIAMVHADINQKELALLSGISETTISQTLSGKTSPNTRTLSRLAAAMKISYSDLIKLGE
jgi:transcriptional regulator with XRE-family HTH domain